MGKLISIVGLFLLSPVLLAQTHPPELAAQLEALRALEANGDPRDELALRLAVLPKLWDAKDLPALRRHAERAVELAREQRHDENLAEALDFLGDANRYLGDYEAALTATTEAIALYETLGDLVRLGNLLDNAGVTYRRKGDFLAALAHYQRALAIFEELGHPSNIGRVLNHMGVVYRRLGQNADALAVYRRALALREKEGDDAAVSRLLNNIGIIVRMEGDLESAKELYERSLAIKKRIGDEVGAAYSLNNLGHYYEAIGELDTARDHYLEALEIRERYFERNAIPSLLVNLGRIHRRLGELDTARETLEKAIALSAEILAREDERNAWYELAKIYTAAGDFAEAIAAFEKYDALREALFNEYSSQVLAEMRTRFDSEQKAKEIELLEKQQKIAALELDRQEMISWSLAIGVGLLAAVLVLLAGRFRLKMVAAEERSRQEERERTIRVLEAKQAEIEARNEEMERFTYTVSHDLKAPLITIRGFLGFLEKDAASGDADRMAKDIARIHEAAAGMSVLLDDLLDFSRVGRMANPRQEIALSELVEEAVEILSGTLTGRGVEIVVASDLPSTYGDRPRLLQVFQNLIENAVKYMGEQEKPRVEIAHRRDVAAGDDRTDDDRTVVFVRDNGRGIDAAYHEQIFGLFRRLDSDKEGTGVGLALVERIVENHGGRIWVESDGLGRGSTFCLELPWIAAPSPDAPRNAGDPGAKPSPPRPTG